jgi:hypothetical protein
MKQSRNLEMSLFDHLKEDREVYRVQQPLLFGRMVAGRKVEREFAPGEEVELTKHEAGPLLEVGTVVRI